LHSLFSSEKFLSRFHDKGRFDDWLKNIPIVLCKNTQAPTIGAFYFLRESSSEHVAVL
jgi:glucokinase